MITFVRAKGSQEEATEWAKARGKTLLFSGGLDSLAGAVDLIDEFGSDGVQLASHITANQVTRSSQDGLVSYLESSYRTKLKRVVIRTGGRKHGGLDFPSDDAREETQRTRSFMFLAIAALAARRSGHSELVMIAENGQMAIHLPLSAARVGAFSTHTAHPDFVHAVGNFFTELLGHPIHITNPYLYRTKAEVVTKLVRTHPDAVKMSVSCWRGSRLSREYNHCGECVPCLIRRVSVEFNGLVIPEYERHLLSLNVGALPPNDEGKRNASELAGFAYTFNERSDADIEFDYPDLYGEHIDREQAIAMYRRFAKEAQQVLGKYAGMRSLLPTTAGKSPSMKATPKKGDSSSRVPSRKSSTRKKRT